MRKLFLNAGHVGAHTGASGPIDEGAQTIVFRDKVAAELRKRGIEPILDDNTMPLRELIKTINAEAGVADLSVDIHFNSFNKTAHGTETLIKRGYSSVECELAEQLLLACTSTMGTRNRGVKDEGKSQHKRLAILNDVKCNSVLVEICFCDNQEDCDKYFEHEPELVEAFANVLERFVKQ